MQVVNFIPGRPLHDRLLKLFCEKMGNEHQVLFHTEVRWVSREKILTRMAKLKEEIAIFLREYQGNFVDKFEDEVFILSLPILQIYSCKACMLIIFFAQRRSKPSKSSRSGSVELKEEVWKTFRLLKKIWG